MLKNNVELLCTLYQNYIALKQERDWQECEILLPAGFPRKRLRSGSSLAAIKEKIKTMENEEFILNVRIGGIGNAER